METYEFPQFAPSYCIVHVALFRSTSNASQLLQDLKSKGADAFPIQLALIDAAYITSREHLLIAIHQALLSNSRTATEAASLSKVQSQAPVRGLKTKSIHSEILWNLSVFSNIMDSFRTFGVSGDTKDVIAVHIAEQVSPEPREVLSLVRLVVEGSLQDDGLHALNYWKETIETTTEKVGSPVDWDLVRRAYKLEGFTDPRKVENLVTSLVAMKSVAA